MCVSQATQNPVSKRFEGQVGACAPQKCRAPVDTLRYGALGVEVEPFSTVEAWTHFNTKITFH